MNAQFVTYADFGTQHNLKTDDIAGAIDFFEHQNALGSVVFRTGKTKNTHYIAAIPYGLHALLGLVRKYISINTRAVEEWFFDRFALKKSSPATVTFFHPPRFPSTMRWVRKNGSCTVGIVTNSDPTYVAALYHEELLRQHEQSEREKITEKYYTKDTDYLVALSPFSKSTYVVQGYPADRIYVARLDVDTDRFIPGTPSADFTVLFPCSSIGILKGLQYVLDAWKKLSIPNKRLIILGKRQGWPRVMEQRYASYIASDPSIKEMGIVSNPELFFQQARVTILPTFTEGFSRAIAESLSCGVPAIITDRATDTTAFFKDAVHGKIVPVADTDALVAAMQYFYEHEAERVLMGQQGRVLMREKVRFGEELFLIYQDILRREGKV